MEMSQQELEHVLESDYFVVGFDVDVGGGDGDLQTP